LFDAARQSPRQCPLRRRNFLRGSRIRHFFIIRAGLIFLTADPQIQQGPFEVDACHQLPQRTKSQRRDDQRRRKPKQPCGRQDALAGQKRGADHPPGDRAVNGTAAWDKNAIIGSRSPLSATPKKKTNGNMFMPTAHNRGKGKRANQTEIVQTAPPHKTASGGTANHIHDAALRKPSRTANNTSASKHGRQSRPSTRRRDNRTNPSAAKGRFTSATCRLTARSRTEAAPKTATSKNHSATTDTETIAERSSDCTCVKTIPGKTKNTTRQKNDTGPAHSPFSTSPLPTHCPPQRRRGTMASRSRMRKA
jgi:hypothetical protein